MIAVGIKYQRVLTSLITNKGTSLLYYYLSTNSKVNIKSTIITMNDNSNEGPIMSLVRQRITDGLKDKYDGLYIHIENESKNHATLPGAESHLKVLVVSSAFEGLKPIEKHRLIYHLVGEELKSSIHAFSIIAKTPKQYHNDPSISKSPPCLGGMK